MRFTGCRHFFSVLIIALSLLGCNQTSVKNRESGVAGKPGDLTGMWDVRWEGVSFVFGKSVPMHGYLEITDTAEGIKATFMEEEIDVRLDGNRIEFSYDEALRMETSTRMGQVTVTFAGTIDGNTMQGKVSRIDGVVNKKNIGMSRGMLIYDVNAAPGFLPETLAQGELYPVRIKDLSDTWHANRVELKAPVNISGVWAPRPEMSNEWLLFFQDWLTEEAVERRTQWKRYEDPALRCSSAGLMRITGFPLPFDIVQSDRVIAIVYEGESASRRIHTDGRDIPEDWLPSGMGYSVGKWNGPVLEVTTKLIAPNLISALGVEHRGEQTVVKEKYSMTTDGKFLRVETIMEDPLTYTRPLRRIRVWERDMDMELVPYDCDGYTFFRGMHEDGTDEEYFSKFPKY